MLYQCAPLETLVDINPRVSLSKETDHAFVAMEDLSPGTRYVQASRRRTLAGGAKFMPGDTLLARITPCLENGKVAQYDPAGEPGFGSTEFIVIRAKPDRADPAYAFYLAASDWVRGPAIGSMSGASGRQRADAGVIRQASVPTPPLETQRRIAGILGAYDDLIAVNRRRVAVLEGMARGLFEEWFVRLRFPGHEQVPIHDTPNGPLPEGWEVGELGKLLRLHYGKALKADTRVPGAVAVIGSSGVVGSHTTHLVKGPGIVVGRKGNVGSVIWSAIDFWPIDTSYFVETPLPLMYVYELLRRVPFQNTDAAVPGLNRDYALSRKVIVPSLDLIERYGRFAQPLRDQVDALETANAKLAAARDLLLPRLISGQLSVAAAERQLADAA